MPTMPNVVGQNYDEAIETLTSAGIYANTPSYAFLPPQVTVQWAQGGTPGTVSAQAPGAGSNVALGAPLTLTVYQFPVSAVIG